LGEIDELIVKDSTDVGKKIKSLELESGDDNGI
jgi:hypothetical protein